MILNRILIAAAAVSFPSFALAGSLLVLEESGETRSIVTIGAAPSERSSILPAGESTPVPARPEERSAGRPLPVTMMIRGGLVSHADGPVAVSRSPGGDAGGESPAAAPAGMRDGAPPAERVRPPGGGGLRPR